MAVVRFAFARGAERNAIPANAADKRSPGYPGRACDKPGQGCFGDMVTTKYFRHQVRALAPGEHGDYRDETHPPKQAKALLQQQRWVAVPPVFPRRAEGYPAPLRPPNARVPALAGWQTSWTRYSPTYGAGRSPWARRGSARKAGKAVAGCMSQSRLATLKGFEHLFQYF